MDHGVQLADGPHGKPGVELLPGRHDRHPLDDVGRVAADPVGHRLDGEDRGVGGAQVVAEKWSGCSWVTSTAVAPSTASGPVHPPGSITSAAPSCSTRTHACPNFVIRIPPTYAPRRDGSQITA